MKFQLAQEGVIIDAKEVGGGVIQTKVYTTDEVIHALNAGDKTYLRASSEARQFIALVGERLVQADPHFIRRAHDARNVAIRDALERLLLA